MPKKQRLTVAELKSLLLARFNADQSRQAKLLARFHRECGNEVPAENPKTIAIRNKFADWISDILARRLKRDRRTIPLLTSRDFDQFIPSMTSEIARAEGYELEAGESERFEKYLKAILETNLEMMYAMVPPRKNPYEESWRWVTTVLDLADEHGILPTQLLTLEDAADEIMRRMFSKRQYVVIAKRAANKFLDADMLKTIVQPKLDMIAKGNEERRRELERKLEAELMPQWRETAEKSKVIFNTWLDEEVERIYTTTA